MLTAEYPTRAGQLRFVSFESKLLSGNRFGDPTLRHHPVYLPAGYARSPQSCYPVVYALAGYGNSGLGLFAPGTFTEPLHDRLDRLIADGMPEVIVVGLECMTSLGGSQYVNGAGGPYEDYVVEEVLPAVEAELRTTAAEAGRGLLGKSSGGFGVLVLAMRHPELFSAVACHSGDMGFEQTFIPEIPGVIAELDRFPGDEDAKVAAFLDLFRLSPRRTPAQGHALMMLACSAAYSPDPQRRVGFVLPFDPATGELRAEVWERWLAMDPLRLASQPAHAQALRELRLLFVDCGSRDPYGLHLGARRLRHLLNQLGVRHDYEEFDDGHSGVHYRYDVSLPKLAAALVAAGP